MSLEFADVVMGGERKDRGEERQLHYLFGRKIRK
jgi:hypothetical protein